MSSAAGRSSVASSKTPALHPNGATTQVEFGGQKVEKLVDSRAGQVYAPNFYYRTSSVQLVFLAPLGHLKPRLPSPLEPITALPGYGLVALTFYSYRPGKDSYSTTQLLGSIWNRTFYGYVLALPVDTEIARVRGSDDDNNIKADTTETDGTPNLKLEVPLPALKTIPSQSAIATNNAINNIDGKWYQVAVQMNPLVAAQCLFPCNVKLSRSDELGVGTILRMDVLKDAQMVLNMPSPLEAFDNVGV
ncbi:hypothetical protein BJX63DRAFT_424973 [Aspergillus granulosus]|uniref:Acetoacetate decarboxylase n=1 Tax=Aspergillus granulosus TaxID=176169 RepID=A0ABR4GXS1_9EURO